MDSYQRWEASLRRALLLLPAGAHPAALRCAALQVYVHPMLIGGWCGLVATAFNSLPAGNLDGGRSFLVSCCACCARCACIMLLPASLPISDPTSPHPTPPPHNGHLIPHPAPPHPTRAGLLWPQRPGGEQRADLHWTGPLPAGLLPGLALRHLSAGVPARGGKVSWRREKPV